jgi:hypothetical protein
MDSRLRGIADGRERLRRTGIDPILPPMTKRTRWQRWRRNPAMRHVLFALGWVLIVAAIPVGLLPGPGGVFVFAAGLALILEASPWAKRVYARVGRRWPKLGGWMDWGLRRRSAKRRIARDTPALAATTD